MGLVILVNRCGVMVQEAVVVDVCGSGLRWEGWPGGHLIPGGGR